MDWTESIQEAIDFIEYNIKEKISIKEIADEVYISEFHFQRIFSLIVGMPVGEYIRNRRLSEAAALLKEKKCTVAEAACDFGYESTESFVKAFTRFHGITPSSVIQGARCKSFDKMIIEVVKTGGFDSALSLPYPDVLNFNVIEVRNCCFIGKGIETEYLRAELKRALIKSEYRGIDNTLDKYESAVADMPGTVYCVINQRNRNSNNKRYMLGKIVKRGSKVPEGYSNINIENGIYAVGKFKGETEVMSEALAYYIGTEIARRTELNTVSGKKAFYAEYYPVNTDFGKNEITEAICMVACKKSGRRNIMTKLFVKENKMTTRNKKAIERDSKEVNVASVYRQEMPSVRFIGRKYTDSDRVDGCFYTYWQEYHNNKYDELIRSVAKAADFKHSDACIGLMRWKENEPFEYWIGMFVKAGSAVPQGFSCVDFPPSAIGVAVLQGKDVFGKEHVAANACEEQGYAPIADNKGNFWFYERYTVQSEESLEKVRKGSDKNEEVEICHFIKFYNAL